MSKQKQKPKKSLLASTFSNPLEEPNPVFWTAVGGALTALGGPLSGFGMGLLGAGLKVIHDEYMSEDSK
jgi:predicted lipid-binding transport protein (Tim44 family)